MTLCAELEADVEDRIEGRDCPPITSIAWPWHLAWLSAGRERQYADDLRANGVAAYLPEIEVVYANRTRRMIVAFPGYLFLATDDISTARETRLPRTPKIMAIVDQARIIEELSNLQRALEANPRMVAWPFLVPGKKVRIASGPLAGICGVIERRDDARMIVHLRASSLGSCAIEVSAGDVEVADGKA